MTRRRLSLLLVLVLGLVCGPIAGAEDARTATSLPVAGLSLEELGQEPRIVTALLSPTGDRVAVLMRRAAPQNTGTSNSSPEATKAMEAMELTWLDSKGGHPGPRLLVHSVDRLWWSTDGEVLFLLAGDRLGRWVLDQPRPAWIYRFEEQNTQEPWGVDRSMPRHFLISDEPTPRQAFRLQRLDAEGNLSVILEQSTPIVDFLLGDGGEIRFLKTVDQDEQVILQRFADDDREILRCPVIDPCELLGFDETTLWLRSRFEDDAFDRDLLQLTAIDLKNLKGRRVHADPESSGELEAVAWNAGGRPLLAVYETDRLKFYGVEKQTEAHAARLRRDFAGSELRIQARSLDSPWLLEERASDLHHPRHHLYDPRTGERREILSAERASAPMVGADRLATQGPISYAATDGRTIHGYVWRPKGDLKRAPMVAWIHGGPWSRVSYGFNRAAQLLVDRGYVVFQPNFRGSSGYGAAHLRAGKGELSRGKVQQDILDGIDYLAGSGIGDRNNVAIIGHSYGGFAALAAAAFHGERYRAAVATAAPINLVRTFRELDINHPGRHGLPLASWVRELLVDLDDPEALAAELERSPEKHVEKTSIPVLLVGGAKDDRVAIKDVKHYASRLHEAGKSVGLWIDQEAGHNFETPHMAPSVAWLTERFLAEHLGGRQLPPKNTEIEIYLSSRAVLSSSAAAP